MKAFYAIFLLVFLASCGANTVTQVVNETTDTPVAEEVTVNVEEDIDLEISDEDEPLEPSNEDEPLEPSDDDVILETSSEIDAELDAMANEDKMMEEVETEVETETDPEPQPIEVSSSQMIELSTTYTNPAMQAVMDIALEINANNVIESIEVTSPNYKGMVTFNQAVQAVVGMSVSEASEFYVSGSSLASPAFQKALKGSM